MKKILLAILFCLVSSGAWGATAFNVSVAPSGGDYSTLQGIFTAAGTIDLTSAATKVFAITGGITGTMTDNTAVTGVTSGATGTCVHASSVNGQILIKSISGTFQNGEIVYETLGVNYVTLGDAGNSPYLNVIISGTWSSNDTTAVSISGETTSATNNIVISTTGSSRHNGKWKTDGYIKYDTNNGTGRMSINNDYVTIDGLQFDEFNTFNYNDQGWVLEDITNANQHLTITNCIFRDNRTSTNADSLVIIADTDFLVMYNCIFYEIGNKVSTAFNLKSTDVPKTSILYNNNFYGFNIGISTVAGSSVSLYNNICNNNNTDYSLAGSVSAHSNNISQDATSPDTSYRSLTVSFTNAASYDFSLSPSDTAATGAGANESSVFTTDIIGTTRTAPWDIGAFKAASTAVNHGFTRFLN